MIRAVASPPPIAKACRVVMRTFTFVCLTVFGAMPALSNPISGPCRVESQQTALAVCLEMTFAQRVLKMSSSIADTLAHLQAARPNELRALQRQYSDAQNIWVERVTENCSRIEGSDTVALQICRLEALAPREERLALSLQRAADDFGAPLTYAVPTPKSVEIHIPLAIPLPIGGVAELPLLLPISPD